MFTWHISNGAIELKKIAATENRAVIPSMLRSLQIQSLAMPSLRPKSIQVALNGSDKRFGDEKVCLSSNILIGSLQISMGKYFANCQSWLPRG